MSSTSSTSSSGSTSSLSTSTVACAVARLTRASSTPSTLSSFFSTRAAHAAHVMPSTASSTSSFESSSGPGSVGLVGASVLIYSPPLLPRASCGLVAGVFDGAAHRAVVNCVPGDRDRAAAEVHVDRADAVDTLDGVADRLHTAITAHPLNRVAPLRARHGHLLVRTVT